MFDPSKIRNDSTAIAVSIEGAMEREGREALAQKVRDFVAKECKGHEVRTLWAEVYPSMLGSPVCYVP